MFFSFQPEKYYAFGVNWLFLSTVIDQSRTQDRYCYHPQPVDYKFK